MKKRTLLTTTLALCRERSADELHKQTGLPYNWLYKLLREEIPDPSVNRIEKLYSHLTGKDLISDDLA